MPEAFRPVPDVAPEETPQTNVQAREEPEALVEVRGTSAARGRGGRGSGSSGPGHRAPLAGRVDKLRAVPPRTRRGPKKTGHQRRFAASRPSGHHPLLNPWDLVPMEIRSSRSGQERSIFRTRGFLVSHLDFPILGSTND